MSDDDRPRTHYAGSYEARAPRGPVVVETADTAPPAGAGDVDVWLSEWQVAEDAFVASVGETVEWVVVPADEAWVELLCAGRRPVRLDRDTYADATGRSGTMTVTGRVSRLDQVSTAFEPTLDEEGRGQLSPVPGGAVGHEVLSTDERRGHAGRLVGWVARLRRAAVTPRG